jgi:hypothetical protein
MNSLLDAVQPVLSQPTPAALVTLQGAVLAWEQDEGEVAGVLELVGRFHAYLSELESKITSRNYSELASLLDIGAVGAVALENILSSRGGEDFWQVLLLGGVAEGLMVAASRQYIKGWEVETGLVHTHAAWYLSEALWRTSQEMQPDLPAEARWQAIQDLLAPVYSKEVAAAEKAVLLGRIFQVLLLARLAGLQSPVDEEG